MNIDETTYNTIFDSAREAALEDRPFFDMYQPGSDESRAYTMGYATGVCIGDTKASLVLVTSDDEVMIEEITDPSAREPNVKWLTNNDLGGPTETAFFVMPNGERVKLHGDLWRDLEGNAPEDDLELIYAKALIGNLTHDDIVEVVEQARSEMEEIPDAPAPG